MKVMRKIVAIDEELCDGCGQCVPGCAEGAIDIVDGKAMIVSESYCDGLGACLGECPNGAISIVEREADDFDEEAVERYLEEKQKAEEPGEAAQAGGCPSAHVQTFIPDASAIHAIDNDIQAATASALSHWPVQINLVPPTAPFLRGADLLVAADCTGFAYPRFHKDFLEGKVLMTGCPKFDDVEAYIRKFSDIFKSSDIKSVTVVVMEVPCCSGLPMIVKRAMEDAGEDIPMEQVTISTRGEILKKERRAA